MVKKFIFFLLLVICFYSSSLNAVEWKDWELGGELGLGVGSGSKSGKILCPAIMGTATRTLDNKFLELGIGYMFGSQITVNYAEDDIDEAYYTEEEEDLKEELKDEAGRDVKIRMSVIPMTVNFSYTIYESFYVGAGVGLYHVFYKREPLGDYRANIDSEKGEIVKSPSTTAMGFQQIVGMEIFPMSEKWSWFVGIKSFLTTAGGKCGGLRGITFGGKVKYTW